jgi:uncharacterized protein involved in outer membrane biogenesis
MKILKWGIPALVLVLVVVVAVVYFSLNSIVRSTVESQTSESMNLRAHVGGANVSLVGRSLGLSNMQIGSPEGYPAPEMFSLNDVNVTVSLRELRQDPIRISSVTIDRPRLVVEREGGRFNLQAAMDQMPPTDSEEELMLIIGRLEVREATVLLRPGLPGLAQEMNITLPTIALENVGSGEGAENGVALKEVVMQVGTAMAAKAAESDSIPEELRALLALDMNQLAARLDAEFTRQFERMTSDLRDRLPLDVGQAVEQALRDPDTARQEAERVIEQRVDEARREALEGLPTEQLEGLRGLRRERAPREQPPPPPAEPQQNTNGTQQ